MTATDQQPHVRIPHLSAADISAELERIHRRKRRHTFDTVIYGTGERKNVTAKTHDGEKVFSVWTATSELSLRALLARSSSEPIVCLIDFASPLPADICARIARYKANEVDPERQLADRWGVARIAPDLLQQRPLREALLAGDPPEKGLQGPLLDARLGWRLLLERHAGIPSDIGLGAGFLLRHALESDARDRFMAILERIVGLRDALEAWFETTHGAVALAALRGWLVGKGPDTAALSVLLGELADGAESNAYVKGSLRYFVDAHGFGEVVRGDGLLESLPEWATASRELLRRLAGDSDRDRELKRTLLDRADELVADDAELRAQVARSTCLPSGLRAARTALAEVLSTLGDPVTDGQLRDVHRAFDRLQAHDLAADGDRVRCEMVVRLVAWLHIRRSVPEWPADQVVEPMLALAERYVREGAFVDLARQCARGDRHDALGAAIDGLLTRVDAIRDADDERFAQGLVAWRAEPRADRRVVPIEHALDTFVVPFLKARDDRRVLVLLLDGMSWSAAVDLVMDLQEHHRYAPIAWRPKPDVLGPAVVAALPTLTEVSRAAFFAGRLLDDDEARNTSRDPKRFAAHEGLRRVLQGGPDPVLELKAGVQDTAGGVSPEVIARVKSAEHRVVGVVVNAIDDQLKAGRQIALRYRVSTIKPLHALLKAAAEAGRVVMLCADHGHVRGDRMSYDAPPVGAESGARWRTVGDGESKPRPGEVWVERPAASLPATRQRVALLWDETRTWTSIEHAGEHGGAAMAEVLAPALMVADERVAQEANDDPELDPARLAEPAWWRAHLDGDGRRPTPPPTPAKKGKASRSKTLQLFDESGEKPASRPSEQVWQTFLDSSWMSELGPDKRQVLIDTVLPRLRILHERGDRVHVDVFVAEAKIAMRHRVHGAIRQLQEFTHVEGYEVVKYDPTSETIELNWPVFRHIFLEQADS